MLNIVLFGPPGAGKGTQAARLIEKYGFHHISTGEVIREEIRQGSPLGLSVKGFIDNRAENFKCAGLWKVYGDEKRARELFARYKRCTDIYCALWRAGSSIEPLAVPV